ncbi:MAG: Stage IV sporulation protein FB [Candidatus Anoxychlamydiales bacterium]|nr:Stage IV sporulation protein FB [Candidatus Anoxychlamydiales bacterium]NGX36384.1 Stage IV sporulation protein FB [Candidatus Anoxychlamydiales bacterium]
MKMRSKIPIRIHHFFWIFAALIGFLMSQSLIGTLIWIVIIFVSVIVHELGHAIMALVFKQNPKIELIAMGGLTSYKGDKLKYWQQFLIVLNGPLFGIFLFLIATLILWLNFFTNPTLVGTIKIFQVVNLFWSIVNLLPVLPMDGGQLLRIVLEAIFGIRGFKIALLIGFIIAAAIALFSFAVRYYLLGALFFLFAFQSFDMYRKSKNITPSDRDDTLAEAFAKAQLLMQEGKKRDAQKILEDLRGKTHQGLIFTQATQLLAFLYYEQKDNKKAYEYLLSVKDRLQEDAVCLLHKLAFEEDNYQIVKDLSASCYKLAPTKEVALINARSFAMLGDAKPAGGWLRTAKEFGQIDISKIINEKYFEKIKEDPIFKNFFSK